MSVDLRPRRGSRAHVRSLADFKPAKLRGCFGGLTQGPAFSVGSAIGQLIEANNSSANRVIGSFLPTVASGNWALNGTALLSSDPVNQWDANFIPSQLTSQNGAADFVSAVGFPAGAATQYTISAQFSVDPNLGLANASKLMRFAVFFTAGATREDSITFNPVTGVLVSSTAGIANISIKFFASVANGKTIQILAISFTTPVPPAGGGNGQLRIYPNINAGVGVVEGGAFQAESGTIASAYMATGNGNTIHTRPLGTMPRLSVDRNEISESLALAYSYVSGADNGKLFQLNGQTLTLSIDAANGEEIDIIGAGTITVAGGGNLGVSGAPIAGITSVVVPSDITNKIYNVNGYHAVAITGGLWQLSAIGSNHGVQVFTANGTFTPALGTGNMFLDASAGGGAGGGVPNTLNNAGAGGGGAGGNTKDGIFAVTPGTGVAITIGAAGAAAGGGGNGGAGGNTIIGALLTLTGGTGGTGVSVSGTSTGGGTAGGGGNLGAGVGQDGFGVAGTFALSGAGGTGIFGAGGPQVGAQGAGQTAGKNGTGPGGGGGGAASGPTGGAALAGNGAAGFAAISW